jgi:hypothetical protein
MLTILSRIVAILSQRLRMRLDTVYQAVSNLGKASRKKVFFNANKKRTRRIEDTTSDIIKNSDSAGLSRDADPRDYPLLPIDKMFRPDDCHA